MIVYFNGVSYGLFLSVIFPKPEIAMALVPVLIVPFMLFAGFFSNQNNIPYFFYQFQYLSMFKYGLQSAVMVSK
jgi:ATP-binding cassette, subfamily G (WHITE), eye pigment precursor transporter